MPGPARTNSSGRTSGLDQPARDLDRALSEAPGDLRFLRGVYVDLTGRTPLPTERAAHRGKTRAEVIQAVAGSEPFFQGFYEEELFYFLLIDNFRPSTDVFQSMPAALAARRLSVKDALRSIVSSQFFNARNPGNDTFVTVVLEQLLGMTVQKEVATLEAGKKMYDGKPIKFLGEKGASQSDLVRIAVDHEDFERHLLDRRHAAIFGAPMPRKDLLDAAVRLREQPLCYPELIAGWIGSAAYEEVLRRPRPKSDRVFVRALFVDLLGREAEYQEFRRCRNALQALSDSGPLRSVVIKLMLDSGMVTFEEWEQGDPEARVRAMFLRYLCREPSQQELAVFTEEARKREPRTLVRALLTHPEYHSY